MPLCIRRLQERLSELRLGGHLLPSVSKSR
jgi:hypothetical protein